MKEYYCSAVVKGSYTEYKVNAISEKQAWYKFCQLYGFAIRDFKVISTTNISRNKIEGQISFNI